MEVKVKPEIFRQALKPGVVYSDYKICTIVLSRILNQPLIRIHRTKEFKEFMNGNGWRNFRRYVHTLVKFDPAFKLVYASKQRRYYIYLP